MRIYLCQADRSLAPNKNNSAETDRCEEKEIKRMVTEMMKTELENEELLDSVAGGNRADLEAFEALGAEKGYNNRCMAERMAMANLYKDVGMDTVRWNLNSDERAEFIDKNRNVYSFDEIFEKMKTLPHR